MLGEFFVAKGHILGDDWPKHRAEKSLELSDCSGHLEILFVSDKVHL